jgi:hypothetical protein
MSEVLKIEVAEQSVSVPIDKKVLGQFISGLLGQPQTVERSFKAAFSIDHAWLIHLCSLIFQRVNQQNAPEPLAFEATVLYRDGLSRKVSSYQAFEHFSETQNAVCVGVKIDISLLIQFPGKEIPERQELIFYFSTELKDTTFLETMFGGGLGIGETAVVIRHTERTWADDILNLISKELESIQVHDNSLKKFLRKSFLPFASLLFPISMLITMSIQTWMNSGTRKQLEAHIASLLASHDVSLQGLHEKANALLQSANYVNNEKSGFPLAFLMSIAVPVIVLLLGMALAQPSPSFLLMSKASQKHKTDTEAKQKRKLLVLIGSMVLTIALGVASSFLYDRMK